MRYVLIVFILAICADSIYNRHAEMEEVKAAAATGCLLRTGHSGDKQFIEVDTKCLFRGRAASAAE